MRPVLITGDIFRLQQQGGVSQYTLELAARLGPRCKVVTGLHTSPLVEQIAGYVRNNLRVPSVRGLRHLLAPLNDLVDRSAFIAVSRAIIHVPYYRPPRSLPSGRPVTMTLYDFTYERFPKLAQSAAEAWKHELARRAEIVFCISEATKRDAVEYAGVPAQNIRVAHLASRDWTPIASTPITEQKRPFVLWVAARHPYKNFPRTLEAWATSRVARDSDLLCIGGAPFDSDERATIARLGVRERVKHLRVSDGQLRWAYENALGLLFTTLWEGFGLPVAEAMALGCPVVASTCPALAEVGGTAALYAEAEDTGAIRSTLDTMLERGRSTQVLAALRAQAARFSWDRTTRIHVQAFNEFD